MRTQKTFEQWWEVYMHAEHLSGEQEVALEGMRCTARYREDWQEFLRIISSCHLLSIEHIYYTIGTNGLFCTSRPISKEPSIVVRVWNWFCRTVATI